MKIRLNENEIYEINLPEEIDIDELSMVSLRFTNLSKILSKLNLGLSEEETFVDIKRHNNKYRNSQQWKTLTNNREILKEILTIYYSGNKLELENKFKELGFTMDRSVMSSKRIKELIKYHRIKPEEVGLIKFPSRKDFIDKVRITK
jgi:hypothetical protein